MERSLAAQMLEDLMAKFPQDFDGAMEKIAKWKLVLDELEGYVATARVHPDGWAHAWAQVAEAEERMRRS